MFFDGGVGLGYLTTSPSASVSTSGAVGEGRTGKVSPASAVSMLEDFAASCGYGLGEVFIDDSPPRLLGWASLLQSVTVCRPVAVLVPDVAAWRPTDGMLRVMASRLARVTSAPLVLARPPGPAAASRVNVWVPPRGDRALAL